jgi:hypothetical protein
MHTGIVDTGDKFSVGFNGTDDHIFPEITLIRAAPVIILSPVPMTTAVNCHRCPHRWRKIA